MPTSLRNQQIIALWNRGRLTMREVGEEFGVSRNSVARILYDARQRGDYVLAIGEEITVRRMVAAKLAHDPSFYFKFASAGLAARRAKREARA